MTILTETFPLSSGHQIPEDRLPCGTWQIPEGSEAYDSVTEALKIGYRHIDSALDYGNEQSVGRAIRDSGVPREDVYITTKLPAEIKDAKAAREAFETSMSNLDLGPIDLWLIHAPWPWQDMGSDHKEGNIEVWKIFEEMHAADRVRSIGVSNFDVEDLQSLAYGTEVRPHVNQIRWFIGNTQPETTAYCQQHDILVEGYSPLATGKLARTNDCLTWPRSTARVSPSCRSATCSKKMYCRCRSRSHRSGSRLTPSSTSTSTSTMWQSSTSFRTQSTD